LSMDALRGGAGDARLARYFEGAPRHGHTTDRVTHVLREAILEGVLTPSTWLREAELAKELSVSRTPVREALGRLSVEGLVTITAHQGAMVAPMTIEDVLKVYVVRESLEGLAARLAAKHRSQQDLDALEGLVTEMRRATDEREYPELITLNLVFHRVIREASGNEYVDRFLTQVEHAIRRFGRTTLEVAGRAQEAVEEHARILESIAIGDAEGAERLAGEHMRRARQLRIQMLSD
jgi:DNA-binding GntR family transcriptional regulator